MTNIRFNRRRGGLLQPFLSLVALVSVVVAGCLCRSPMNAGETSGNRAPAHGLVLRIEPEKGEVSNAQALIVSYELENAGERAVYVCQWPGIAFGGGWELPNGETKGFGPGYPSSRKLDRKYFVELKPGEALLGRAIVDVFPTEAGEMKIWGIFRSGQTGEQFELGAWKGEVSSEGVTIRVPKEQPR